MPIGGLHIVARPPYTNSHIPHPRQVVKMMVTPRSYVRSPPRKAGSAEVIEKISYRSTRSQASSPQASSPKSTSPLSSSSFRSGESSPVKSEPRIRVPKLQPQQGHQEEPKRPGPTPLLEKEVPRFRQPVKDVLSSTAIPIRRKQRGRISQRLPKCDYVADFSKLLKDDVSPSAGSYLPRSVSNSNLEGLFGNMDEMLDEGQMFVGSADLDPGILSTRSLSDDSLASLPSPNDFTTSDGDSQHSSASLLIPEKRMRQIATSEDCSEDHPLSPPRSEADPFEHPPEMGSSPPAIRRITKENEKKSRQSLTSSLTASLRALKSATQSVSNRSNPISSNRLSSISARSFFDIQPSMTDDRRPPPSFETPTPELRRYLNPPPLESAAQLHTWQEHRHSQPKLLPQKESRKKSSSPRKSSLSRRNGSVPQGYCTSIVDLPSVVQLVDCLPPSVRTEHASSPPIWLTPDGIPANKMTAVSLRFNPDAKGDSLALRHREPRENRDFLRVFVCEMQMRKSGKLSDDLSAGRARLWLPPIDIKNTVPSSQKKVKASVANDDTLAATFEGQEHKKKTGKERMKCVNIEDV